MGHLFRSLLYACYLKQQGKEFRILINDDPHSIDILRAQEIPFLIVDYSDETDWETPLIEKLHADVWLQDKFETPVFMAEHIRRNPVLFCMIDEFGPGAELCDIHFGGMIYLTGHEMRGKQICCGSEYVILNPEIEQFRRLRSTISNVIISLGGSDPYGMTVEVVRKISETDLSVEVIIGPDFDYKRELESANVRHYPILQNVPSLIEEFSKFDFAITGGGVTCCEANSCGLPCMIIANAPHEIHTGRYMEQLGGAVYAGSYEGWDAELICKIKSMNIAEMSRAGMHSFDTKATERIFTMIEQERVK